MRRPGLAAGISIVLLLLSSPAIGTQNTLLQMVSAEEESQEQQQAQTQNQLQSQIQKLSLEQSSEQTQEQQKAEIKENMETSQENAEDSDSTIYDNGTENTILEGTEEASGENTADTNGAENTDDNTGENEQSGENGETEPEVLGETSNNTGTTIRKARSSVDIQELTEEGGELESGTYQLTTDIELEEDLVIPRNEEVTLDLNGFTLRGTGMGSVIFNKGTLTVEDTSSSEEGTITGGEENDGGGIYNVGILNLFGGNISGNKAERNGGGIYNASSGEFYMYGGCIGTKNVEILWSNQEKTIYPDICNTGYIQEIKREESGCTARYGGGVENEGEFLFYGGLIAGNVSEDSGGGIYHSSKVKFKMSGGIIYGNYSVNNGGGLYLPTKSNKMDMTGGSIICNLAGESGGGANFHGTVKLSNEAEISYNSAVQNGGGFTVESGIKVTITNVSLAHNTAIGGNGSTSGSAAGNGGAIYCLGTLTINGGTFSYNQAGKDGGGICVQGGMAAVNGGTIFENTAECGGGIFTGGGSVNFAGGFIYGNRAIGIPDATTAYDSEQNSGVGGGVFVCGTGSFTLDTGTDLSDPGAGPGLYGNQAEFAADDLYSAPDGSAVVQLSPASRMSILEDEDEGKTKQWYEDYADQDSEYANEKAAYGYQGSEPVLRFRKAAEQNQESKTIFSVAEVSTFENRYLCLAFGYGEEAEEEEEAGGYELPAAGGNGTNTIPLALFLWAAAGIWVAATKKQNKQK